MLVDFVDYLHRPEQTRLAEGAGRLVAEFCKAGIAIGVVTNQAGVDRQLYSWPDYFAVEAEIDRQLAGFDVALDGVAACPFHPEFTRDWSESHAYWRKPGPGMVELLVDGLNLCRKKCWLIGDTADDIGAARAAGLPGAILLLTGHGARNTAAATELASESFEVTVLQDLEAALPFLRQRLALSCDLREQD